MLSDGFLTLKEGEHIQLRDILLPHPKKKSGNFAVSFWIFLSSGDEGGPIFSIGEKFYLSVERQYFYIGTPNQSESLFIRKSDDEYEYDGGFDSDTWVFFTVVVTEDEISFATSDRYIGEIEMALDIPEWTEVICDPISTSTLL